MSVDLLSPYCQNLSKDIWPPLIVEEVENTSQSIPKEDSEYMVQFPDNSPEQFHESVEERPISDAFGGRHSR
jgi:hypothetical protein